MNNEQKNTQQLVDQFRDNLLLRRTQILDNYPKFNEDTLSESFNGDDLISFSNQWGYELTRMRLIFKLIEKGKI